MSGQSYTQSVDVFIIIIIIDIIAPSGQYNSSVALYK